MESITVFKLQRSVLPDPNGPLAKVVPSLGIIAACIAANEAPYLKGLCAVYEAV